MIIHNGTSSCTCYWQLLVTSSTALVTSSDALVTSRNALVAIIHNGMA